MAALQGAHSGEKLVLAKRARATKGRAVAALDQFRHPPYVVVVPVSCHDQRYVSGRIKTYAFKVT